MERRYRGGGEERRRDGEELRRRRDGEEVVRSRGSLERWRGGQGWFVRRKPHNHCVVEWEEWLSV